MTNPFKEWQEQYPEAAAALLAVATPTELDHNDSLTETAVQANCRLHASSYNMFLGRNNSGAYNPKKPPSPGTRWGWCNDSAKLNKVFKTPDLIGWKTIIITPDMVGTQIAQFVGAEVKKPGWALTPSDARGHAQASCGNKIIAAGGLFAFIDNHEQLGNL